MADFSAGAYSRGLQGAAASISATNQGIASRMQIKQRRAEVAAQQQEEQQKRFQETRDKLIEQSLDVFDKITTAAVDAEKTGRLNDEQRAQFRNAAQGALISTMTTLQHDYSLAIRAGADPSHPMLQSIQSKLQSLAGQAPVFDARVTSARASVEDPTILGQRKGKEQAAYIRELATELGLPENDVAERIIGGPGQPAPTELEKLERSLRLMDAENVPDNDPRRLRLLSRLTSMTTPSVADIIAPLIQKMASGEELTDAEQRALDAAQRMSFTEQLLRGVLGAGAGGPTNYTMGPDGNLVPRPQ